MALAGDKRQGYLYHKPGDQARIIDYLNPIRPESTPVTSGRLQ